MILEAFTVLSVLFATFFLIWGLSMNIVTMLLWWSYKQRWNSSMHTLDMTKQLRDTILAPVYFIYLTVYDRWKGKEIPELWQGTEIPLLLCGILILAMVLWFVFSGLSFCYSYRLAKANARV